MDDPYAYIIEDSQMSSSQEEILGHCPFTEDPSGSPGDGVLPTLPETAEDAGEDRGSRDFFINPPEKQSSASKLRPCTSHKAVQTDDETQDFNDFTRYAEEADVYGDLSGDEIRCFDDLIRKADDACVDLSDDSDSWFPLAELNHMIDRTMVAGCSHWNNGASEIEISSRRIEEFQVLGRGLSPEDDVSEPLHKRTKALEQKMGSKSSQACSGTEPQEIGDNLQNCEGKLVSNQMSPCNFVVDSGSQQNTQIGKEMPLGVNDKEKDLVGIAVEKNLGNNENLGRHVTQSGIARNMEDCLQNTESRGPNCEAEELACTGNEDKIANEIVETSEKKGGDKQQRLGMLSPSVLACLKDIAKRKNEYGKDDSFVFYVFKCLTKDVSKKDSSEKVNWLELAKSKGITFPTPRWWKEADNR